MEKKDEKIEKMVKRGFVVRWLVSVFSGSFLTRENAVRQLPFLLFMTIMALGYITNGYYTEQKIREVNKTQNDIKELKSEYITTKSELVFITKQSEVAKAVEPLQLKESMIPPKKIKINNKTVNTIN